MRIWLFCVWRAALYEIVTVLTALRFGGHFEVHFGGAAGEACSVTWVLGANTAYAVEPRKTSEILDRVDRSFVLRST